MTIALRVRETANAPGTAATVNLLGPPLGFRGFLTAFPSGSSVVYLIFEPSTGQWEMGLGTVAAGSPNTLTRPATVSENSAGTTSRLNFTAAVEVLNIFPASSANPSLARLAISAAPLPISGAGPGSWVYLSSPPANPLVLPPGGTWAWFFLSFRASSSLWGGVYNAGTETPGGTTIAVGVTDTVYIGFAWRRT